MLLGIGLHGVISFTTFAVFFWPAVDNSTGSGFDLFFHAVHGFRMPVFFLLSGYFTAMLWRKRGLRALLGHRFRRIFLPLILGWLLIVPLVELASEHALTKRFSGPTSTPPVSVDDWRESDEEASIEVKADPGSPTNDLVAAARSGNLAGVRSALESGVDPDSTDAWETSALHQAAVREQLEVIRALLEAGADVNVRDGDGSTPLHWTTLFARTRAVSVLLESGADTNAAANDGSTPLDIAEADWADLQEIVRYVAALLVMEVDLEAIAREREVLPELLRNAGAEPRSDSEMLGALLRYLMVVPVFHHLWFLWFLCWLLVPFSVVAALKTRTGRSLLPDWLFEAPLCLVWLVPLTMVPQAWMHGGGAQPGFGPDTSAGWLPFPHLLLFYWIFFWFGAEVYDRPRAAQRLGRGWWLSLPLALLVFLPYGLFLSGARETLPQWLYRPESVGDERQLWSMVTQVLYGWLMCLGLVGLFRALLRRERSWIRYLSDSSYWLYIAHLPILIWMQGEVAGWELPAIWKALAICSATTLLLLISYEWGVRYTPIGSLLNGRKHRAEHPAHSRSAP